MGLCLVVALAGLGVTGCEGDTLPERPQECTQDGKGCLTDEFCNADGFCEKFPNCDDDDDCPSSSYRCVFPARICELRPGFGLECGPETFCEPGSFCALGRCNIIAEARQCARRADCPQGQACDRQTFLCIPEGPCTLADEFPELACDPGETCDPISERCALECQNECTPATEEEDCGLGSRCDGACRCVQCLNDADCGPGLLCNTRAGRCESEDLCFSDDDCEEPLICDPATALCQVPPPPCESDLDCNIAEVCNRATGICVLPGGACVDDRFENADTPAAAEEFALAADGTPLVIDDLQLCPDDDDVYAINLAAGDQLVARIYSTMPQARGTVWLLDSEGETSLRFAEAPPYGNGTVEYVAQVDERVYLRVNALLGATPYEMELIRRPGTPCAADVFEGEAGNDTFDSPTPAGGLPIGATVNASLCPSDADFYAIDLGIDEGIEVTLAFDSTRADLDLVLMDANTGVTLVQSSGTFEPEVIRFRTPEPRNIVVGVRGFGNANGPYSLRVERLPPLQCAADPGEPDNTVEDALVLGLGENLDAVPRALCANDVDSVLVQLEDFERLVARAAFSPVELDLEVQVRDATGETLYVTSPNGGQGETAVYDAQGDETVLVQVKSRFNTRGAYKLSIFRENQAECLPDDSEPNETPEVAAPAPTGSVSRTLCPGDEDVFAVQATGGKLLIATATFLHSRGDIDVQILNFDGTQVLNSADGVDDTEKAELIVPLDGIYFVRVFSLDETTNSRYELTIEEVSP